ncbi:hypothetical protein CDAR_286491 [Caerostris darwini]|uniref:Secreted protein n=1 Tax=Caerostris darwini TaxID=1538125 RepID=A0AAV4W107_9ARAC|nr:hypothetical protein CDAR_286491 [Caerostris darwini]
MRLSLLSVCHSMAMMVWTEEERLSHHSTPSKKFLEGPSRAFCWWARRGGGGGEKTAMGGMTYGAENESVLITPRLTRVGEGRQDAGVGKDAKVPLCPPPPALSSPPSPVRFR